MNYGLCKQLKDAGFNQQEPGEYLYPDYPYMVREDVSAKIPTLSELIESCQHFPHQFSLYGRDFDRWEATLIPIQIFGSNMLSNKTEYGSTPEEAVANLYLALKQNDTTSDDRHTNRIQEII